MYKLTDIEDYLLGDYTLPFVTTNGIKEKEVEVVYISGKKSRMWVIIIKTKDGGYQDFYYNDLHGAFKLLTYNCGDEYEDFTFRESWISEEVGDKLPIEFKDYKPKPFNWDNI